MQINETQDPRGEGHETYEVLSTSGSRYTVRYEGLSDQNYETDPEYDAGYWSCTCPAHRFHPDRDCKHIQAVVAHTVKDAA